MSHFWYHPVGHLIIFPSSHPNENFQMQKPNNLAGKSTSPPFAKSVYRQKLVSLDHYHWWRSSTGHSGYRHTHCPWWSIFHGLSMSLQNTKLLRSLSCLFDAKWLCDFAARCCYLQGLGGGDWVPMLVHALQIPCLSTARRFLEAVSFWYLREHRRNLATETSVLLECVNPLDLPYVGTNGVESPLPRRNCQHWLRMHWKYFGWHTFWLQTITTDDAPFTKGIQSLW